MENSIIVIYLMVGQHLREGFAMYILKRQDEEIDALYSSPS